MATQSTKIGSGKVRVHVAAFGKHPGWDDHIEEIGLDSDELVKVKRLLYTEGMSGNIDAGAWEKLDESKRLPAFAHVFYWKDRDSLIIGRLWSSSDGKGRTKYPMVVVAQVEGVPQWWAVEQILQRLETAEARCAGGKTADAVRAAIGECRRGLEDAAALLTVSPSGGVSDSELLRRLVSDSALDADGQRGLGLTRILYEMDREMAPYKSGASRTRTASITLSPAHVRVPRCLSGPGEGARAWMALLRRELSGGAPALVIEPLGRDWLDVVVGAPNPASLFCVRTDESGLAYASRIPYSIPSEFATSASERIAGWSAEQPSQIKSKPVASDPESTKAGFSLSKWALPVGGIALLVIGVAILSMARCGGGGDVRQVAVSPPAGTTPPPAPQPQATLPDAGPAAIPTPKPDLSTPAVKTGPGSPAESTPKPSTTVQPADAAPAVSKPVEPPVIKPAPIITGADPRGGWSIRADLVRAADNLDALDAALVAEGSRPDASLRARLEKARERSELVRVMPWNDANAVAVRRGIETVNSDLSAIEQDSAAALSGVRDRIRQSLAAHPAPVRAAPFVKAWADALAGIDVAVGKEAASARVETLAAALIESERAFDQDPFAKPITPVPAVDTGAINAAASTRRETAMAESARLAAAGDGAGASAVAAGYLRWAQAAHALSVDAAALSAAIGAGAGMDTPAVAGSPTLASAAEKLQSSPAMNDLAPSLGQLLARLVELKKISTSDDTGLLADKVVAAAAESSPLAPAEALMAWERLAMLGWPTDEGGLDRALQLRSGPLAANVARIVEPHRQSAEQRAAAASSAIWNNFVHAKGGTEEGLTRALSTRSLFGADEATIRQGWLGYNLALREFLTATRSETTDGAFRAAAQKFLNDATAAGPAVLATPGAAAFLNTVRALVEKPPSADLSKFGPGAAGWLFQPGKDGAAVYTWSRGGVDHTLTFLPVKSSSETGLFICTSELSVGLFIDAISAANRWEDVRRAMSNRPEPGLPDARIGPRPWVWRRAPEVIALSRSASDDKSLGWLSGVSGLGDNLYYSPELSRQPAAPSLDSPMQYLSPVAAVIAAKALGCRIPTAEEWTAALGEKPATGNVRDASWKKQFSHVQTLVAKGFDVPGPGSGAFRPFGTAKPSAADEGAAVTDADDGFLWFAPINSGAGAFEHLLGNVAEYVTEDAAGLDAIAGPDGVYAAAERAEKVKVIGGSAIAPPSIDPRVPQAVGRTQARGGFADVGLRLAFPAPRSGGGSETDWRKQVLGQAAYLPPAK